MRGEGGTYELRRLLANNGYLPGMLIHTNKLDELRERAGLQSLEYAAMVARGEKLKVTGPLK